MLIKKTSRVLARVVSALFLVGAGFVFSFGQFVAPNAGVTQETVDATLWVVVAAFGLATLCFAIWPALAEEPELQREMRHSGVTFSLATGLFVVVAALASGTSMAARVGGAATDPPFDQVVLPAVMVLLGLIGLMLVTQALYAFVRVSLELYFLNALRAKPSAPSPD